MLVIPKSDVLQGCPLISRGECMVMNKVHNLSSGSSLNLQELEPEIDLKQG